MDSLNLYDKFIVESLNGIYGPGVITTQSYPVPVSIVYLLDGGSSPYECSILATGNIFLRLCGAL